MRPIALLFSLFFSFSSWASAPAQFSAKNHKRQKISIFASNRMPEDDEVLQQYGAAHEGQLAQTDSFGVLIWNIFKFQKPNSREDVSSLSTVSDFVLLQEAMMRGEFADYFNQLNAFFWVAAISFINGDNLGTGVITGGHFDPDYSVAVRSLAREPLAGTPKMFVLNRYPIFGSEQELMVANIHAVNFVAMAAYSSQIEQLEQELVKHDGPILLGGDFNTHVPGRMGRLTEMMTRLSLDHVAIANQSHSHFILDHIFTRGLNAISAESLNGYESSDHKPIYGRFSLK